eukprot:GHVQ01027318.1.p1 GENE.GHVQ01027318.1~~GHVQ01027318.1.p1  ORF type:complete len:390 (+),score=77.89 GHVQ01027318.1:113-1171(+)
MPPSVPNPFNRPSSLVTPSMMFYPRLHLSSIIQTHQHHLPSYSRFSHSMSSCLSSSKDKLTLSSLPPFTPSPPITTSLSLLNLSPPRLSGAPKPTWKVPTEHMFHPQIPDKHHYMDSPSLSGPLLWLRACRPYLEKIAADVYGSSRRLFVESMWYPCVACWKRHNPEFRLELVAVLSFFVVQYCITYYFSKTFQYVVDLKNAVLMHHAKDLFENHFFDSESEIMEQQAETHAQDHARLNALWEEALNEATVNRSFEVLCSKLKVTDETTIPPYKDYRNIVRFDMIPYGKDNQHTQTFAVPHHDKPLRAFSLNFTYNNLSGDWGDYIDRQDNKSAPLRHARPLFTDVYIPGTK